MTEHVMACLKGGNDNYLDAKEARRAKKRDKELTKLLKEQHKQDLKRLKILLLGTGESGKSTIAKQMRIIHINGFDRKERMKKISDIRRNIKESIVVILLAMQQLEIELKNPENEKSKNFILQEAGNPEIQSTDEFMEHTKRLWADPGVLECFSRSNEYQLIDCAQYFLDKIDEVKSQSYEPSDQDILRCRVITTTIQQIEFDVPDGGHQVRFSVYDVGGQQGERKKWIQVFDSVATILFLADCSSFDQTLREDTTKNRLLEALEIFEQVWKNRFLRYVSVLLFINKIDILVEKVSRGHYISQLCKKHPDIFPNYNEFVPTNAEKLEFLHAFPNPDTKKKRSKPDIHPEAIKTAVYIKHLFLNIVKGDLHLKFDPLPKSFHQNHSCEYFYTCAIDTNNIDRVLHGCRALIIRKHLERFGIM